MGIHGTNVKVTSLTESSLAGVGVECDNAVDTFLEAVHVAGTANNITAVPLIIDSACNGTQITDFVGDYAGLHGFVVRNTLGGASLTGFSPKD